MLCLERRDKKHRPLEPTELEINSECSLGRVRLAENVNRDPADDELLISLSLERNISAVVSSSIVQVRSAALRGNGAQWQDSRPEDGVCCSNGGFAQQQAAEGGKLQRAAAVQSIAA
jgi:hypothetical protein